MKFRSLNYSNFIDGNSNSMQTAVRSSFFYVHCISLRCESKFLRSVNLIGLVISPFSESRFSCGGSSCTDMARDGSRSQEDSPVQLEAILSIHSNVNSVLVSAYNELVRVSCT